MALGKLTVGIATVEQILPVRHAVLRPNLPASTANFEGDDEPETLHIAAVDAGQVVGCTTLLRRPLDGQPAWQLRGMAVLPGFQGRGVGKAVLRCAIEQAVATPESPVLFWCNARQIAIPFYERLGWRCITAFFDVPAVGPHRKMRYDHPRVTR